MPDWNTEPDRHTDSTGYTIESPHTERVQTPQEQKDFVDAALNTYNATWWGVKLQEALAENNIEALLFVKYIYKRDFNRNA